MRSSTSSSNDRLPRGPWRATWLLTIALVAGTLGGLELAWRAMGHLPDVSDDASLWAATRVSVRGNDPGEVVLIGASRMQQDIDLGAFARVVGGRKPVQLAVGGSTFVPVLDELSRDESFRGIVIGDVVPNLFYEGGLSVDTGVQAEYVRAYRNVVGLSKRISLTVAERRLRTAIQSHVVLRVPSLLPTILNVQLWWERGSLPGPSGRQTFADRSQKSDYRRLDRDTLERTRQLWVQRIREKGHGPSPDVFLRDLGNLEAMVRRIQARGGRVVFAALPVNGIVKAAEEEAEPRKDYWDVMAARTSAVTIHVDDYPELASFECLEGSHLDYRDATVFTERFAAIVRRQLATESR